MNAVLLFSCYCCLALSIGNMNCVTCAFDIKVASFSAVSDRSFASTFALELIAIL